MAPKGAQKVKDEDSVSSERSDQKLGSASPKDIKQANVPAVAAVGASKYCPYIIGALVILIITGGVYYYKYRGYEVVYENKRFDFYSLCPAIYAFQNVSAQSSNKDLYDAYIQKYRSKLQNTYIVTAKAGQTLSDKDQKYSELRIRYCGLAKKGNGTCENDAIFMCSNPGPYFDVQENQQIKVVWINDYINLNQPNSSHTRNSYDFVEGFSVNNCFNPIDDPKNPPSQMCNKTAKSKDDFDLLLFDPTNKIPVDTDCQVQNIKQVDTFPVQSTRYAVPLSPHVHGLEVEPYYDGNPLSWFDSNGNIGIGYYVTKADEEDYIKNQVFKTFLKQLGIRGVNMKVNVYKNVQQPGTLWYHDHSMGVTGLNVMLGLHSFYVIRNKAEKDLPSGQFQRMIMMYTGMKNESSSRDCAKQCDPNFSSDKCNNCLISKQPNKENEDVPLLLNTTYRIRILNGDFRSQFAHIRFILSTCKIQQTIPQNCTEQIPFSVIGTDSTLRRYPVNNVKNISLSPAERIDILITINPLKLKFTNQSKLHVVSDFVKPMNPLPKLNFTKLAEYNVTNKRKGKVVNIKQIDVPWVDLSKVDESQIIGKRMRSLFFTGDFTFGINFNPRFSEGLSENPKIGTIEDWYIVNTVFQPHPIHVHLIQFQAIQIVALKRFEYVGPVKKDDNNYDCSYYLMDAIKRQVQSNKQNGIPVDNQLQQVLNDLQKLCYYSQNGMDATKYSQLFKHKKDEQTFVNGVSGFDVFEKCASAQQCLKYGEKKGSTNMYKYIDPSVNMSQYLQEYQKGWKESFWAPQYAYTKLRLRWTSTDFPQQLMNPLNPQKSEQGCKRGYFHLPQENITQSPGYVYHCHILDHEDNEMMRPIMVQPSGCNNIPTWRERWQEKYCQFKEKKLQRSRQKKANGELRVL